MKQAVKGPRRVLAWLSGSIRRKLTLFVVLVCLLLVGLVWLLLVQLLEPMYNLTIRRSLENNIATVESLLVSAEEEGILYSGNGKDFTVEFKTIMEDALREGRININERSIEVADRNYQYVIAADRMTNSSLHPTSSYFAMTETNWDTPFMMQLRAYVFENGYLYVILNEGQMVVGKPTADEQYTIIAAANLERISQAVDVLRMLLVPVSGLLVLVGVLCAWIFSRWFTRPIRRLSAAAQAVARGNYGIQVAEEGNDEITALARDFNHMAGEVNRSAAMQRDLLANVSHDLRTPLTLIKGYAETIRDLTGDDKQKREEQLDVIVDEADRLGTLVGRVMELSRVSSGHEKPERVLFDLAQLCDEVGYRYAELCRQNGLYFAFHANGEAPVYADPALMERALHNLLGNALNHVGPDGYLGLTVRHTPAATVRVEVEDHGAGILPEDLPYIFDRYYRSRADAGKTGTGLGLSITKAIFLAQDIQYGVSSEPGHGSMFWFELPLA